MNQKTLNRILLATAVILFIASLSSPIAEISALCLLISIFTFGSWFGSYLTTKLTNSTTKVEPEKR